MSKKDKMGGISRFQWWMHRWLDFPRKASEDEINEILGESGTKTIGYQPPRQGLITEGEVYQAERKEKGKKK